MARKADFYLIDMIGSRLSTFSAWRYCYKFARGDHAQKVRHACVDGDNGTFLWAGLGGGPKSAVFAACCVASHSM
eukprot:scaffold143219_cov34-Prasinocladus_malaysianus.AAC.1